MDATAGESQTAGAEVTLLVEGMHCGACTGRVERLLGAVAGVEAAEANLVARKVRVRFGAPASAQTLVAALEDGGYPASLATARLAVEGMSCAACAARVETALSARPGVIAARVNPVTGLAEAEYAQGAVTPSELARAVTAAGYPAHLPDPETQGPTLAERQAAEAETLRRRFLLAAALTAPVFVLAMGGHMIPGFAAAIETTLGTPLNWAIQFVLTTAVLFGPGRMFLTTGLPALWRGAPEMNALVALGALAGWGYSGLVAVAPGLVAPDQRHVYFEAAAMIVTLILMGRWLEARARGRAGAAIARLVALTPDRVRLRRGDTEIEVPAAELARGDEVLIAPGGRIPCDGILIEGTGWVDESMLTGEARPNGKSPGDTLTGGTVNGPAALVMRVTATGGQTVLARIIAMVEAAQGAKLPVQALVDRVTRVFVPVVLGLSALTLGVWLLAGAAFGTALIAAISVMVIACPCAMGLATPVSILVGTGRAAEMGVLFRRGDALQRLSEARWVAFDKTGTLTEGAPRVTDLILADGWTETEALTLAAGAEARSEHPLAAAVVARAREAGLTPPRARKVTATPGRGLSAEVAGKAVLIGNARALDEAGIATAPLAAAAADLAAAGRTPVWLAVAGEAVALMGLADPERAGAAETVAGLRKRGLGVAMVTGDLRATAEVVAGRLGIARVVAEALPEDKLAALEALRAEGTLAFVGDGINDAPALAAADVGIAPGGGTDVAIEAAEVVLMQDDPRGVLRAVALSRAVMRNIRQNLFWAFAYNAALVPVAMGVLVPFGGPGLSPMLAAGAMALSSVFVVSNALRLRTFRAE
ncbi:heavy metal translocating P-type ATPase [Phaeovulum vinaykumarii]|uniref:Cu+-exporting ATPase n=1 Tax=Phaeovulum vinaykumarii TaxID=407234 RepID=A0A1N7LUP5_9RHOB|nr:heavy metal translocating P-type ATPase [Phaeovulum vinaykumarii]SIS77567.1 Cu+-exporting ATPase [Phaeovulum vinaykumarii]SOC07383.1 Cu+-exporting ATPase [Phaeovulum vinaykumarii]